MVGPRTNAQNYATIATGLTPAFLGDERTLREFLVGDEARLRVERSGKTARLLLLVDSYDPLTYRQLRIGLDKDEARIAEWQPHCGKAVAEIPDPFGCHESYAGHFTAAWLERLATLDVHPEVFDAYDDYRRGLYRDAIVATFEHYEAIETIVSQQTGQARNALFRFRCPRCERLDATELVSHRGVCVRYRCRECAMEHEGDAGSLPGKLAWKLTCAVRWNLHGVDIEPFSKRYLTEQGSFETSRVLSERYYGGRVPEVIRYGDVQLEPSLANHLLESLPPALARAMFVRRFRRDLSLTRDFVRASAQRHRLDSGIPYAEYIRRQLPVEALGGEPRDPARRRLVQQGVAFARHVLGVRVGPAPPRREALDEADRPTRLAILALVEEAIDLQGRCPDDEERRRSTLADRLSRRPLTGDACMGLRALVGQEKGPPLVTVLARLSRDYLESARDLLWDHLARDARPPIVADADDAQAQETRSREVGR